MADYYQLLGISTHASPTEIRAAYKKLAMLYHPDRSPDNKEAEELFKLINEAYHVLADPVQKTIYDTGLAYSKQTQQKTAHKTSAYWKKYHRMRYDQWQQAQQNTYTFDKRYFRIQALAILVFLLIAGFSFGIINIFEYIKNEEIKNNQRVNREFISQANILFNSGKEEEALLKIRQWQTQSPADFVFNFAEDSLLTVLRNKANLLFKQLSFEEAGKHYKILQRLETPSSLLTLQRVAECEYRLGQFQSSINILKQLLEVQPNNIDYIYRSAIIYQDNLHDLERAYYYLTLARKHFKERMASLYGEAFEVVMDPTLVHEMYYDIFWRRAEVTWLLKKFDETEKDCSWAIILRPQNGQPYFYRALASIELGINSRLCSDLQRATQLGNTDSKKLLKSYCK